MFTGIIEAMGTIRGIQAAGQGRRLTVEAGFSLETTAIGDSIAVNGACLTAVRITGSRFEADVSPETLSKTSFGGIRIGDRVNLERALRLSDRLNGHLVSGHVDGVGSLQSKTRAGNAVLITIAVPQALSRYMIRKGSVAVDGISLTINDCGPGFFEISVIPHTAAITTIGLRNPGDEVNIETDLIGKYIDQLMRPEPEREGQGGIDLQFLAKTGFL
jgi:riboflavin synthase